LAPELVLNGYGYDRLEACYAISKKALPLLQDLSSNKTLALTLTIKENDKFYNRLHIFHKNRIVHTQDKYRLFDLNDESRYFAQGSLDDIKIIQIDDLKIGALICFELRFIDLWQRLQGCDIILVPAMWGLKRKENFLTLSQALAVANQCFVIASDSASKDMAKGSGIISPFGEALRDDRKTKIEAPIDLREIKKMRRYLPVGISSKDLPS
jgi:predicted amidohydrolase